MNKASILKIMKPILECVSMLNCPSHCKLEDNYHLCDKDKCEECWKEALVKQLESIKE